MCQFVSFGVTVGEVAQFVAATRLNSHEGMEDTNGLKPCKYREAEWTEDDAGASLVVRVEPGEDAREWAKKVLLAFPDRWSLIVHLLKQIGHREYAYLSWCTGLKSLPEGFNPNRADLRGCTGLKSHKS